MLIPTSFSNPLQYFFQSSLLKLTTKPLNTGVGLFQINAAGGHITDKPQCGISQKGVSLS